MIKLRLAKYFIVIRLFERFWFEIGWESAKDDWVLFHVNILHRLPETAWIFFNIEIIKFGVSLGIDDGRV